MKEIIILYRHYFNWQKKLANTNSLLPQVLLAGDIGVSGRRKPVLLAKSSAERRTPRSFVLLLTLRGTHVRLIV